MLQNRIYDRCPDAAAVKASILGEFKRYLDWETASFDGWDQIEVYLADTLSEAWITARPEEADRFQDPKFRRFVNSRNGKWLEKKTPEDSYKVILAAGSDSALCDLTQVLVHEMRHCLDYRNAVSGLDFSEYSPGNTYYNSWSEFRAVYAHVRYLYFSKVHGGETKQDLFRILTELLGWMTADCTEGLIRNRSDSSQCLYFISRYLGASRSVRDLNMQLKTDSAALHIWNMMPQYIHENFGNVFYLGNEWSERQTCSLNAEPAACCYSELLERLQKECCPVCYP